jgi:hypothetical protein
MIQNQEIYELAIAQRREAFLRAVTFPVLVGIEAGAAGSLATRPNPHGLVTATDHLSPPVATAPVRERPTTLFGVRKVQEVFPSMITVGRTPNNDIALKEPRVSKFHAYFRVVEDHVQLCDAGSRNGTWIGEERLDPRGSAGVVLSGEIVRFAHLRYQFLAPGAFWDWVSGARPSRP